MKRQGILITIILIAIVAVGGFIVYRMQKTAVTTNPVPAALNSGTTGAVLSTPTPKPRMQVSAGTTDADLATDSQDVDTKIKALNTDATSIDQGLNDQQGNLSEQ